MKKVIIGFTSGESESMLLSDKDIKHLMRCIRPGLFGRDKIAKVTPMISKDGINVPTGELLIVRRGALSGIAIIEA